MKEGASYISYILHELRVRLFNSIIFFGMIVRNPGHVGCLFEIMCNRLMCGTLFARRPAMWCGM